MRSKFTRYFALCLAALALCSWSAAAAPDGEAPAYSSIALSSKSVTLTVRQLHAIHLKSSKPAGATEAQMTYTSSNPAVAVVEDGNVIRAIAPGSATITVRAINGKAKATLRVKVAGFHKKLRFYDAASDAAQTEEPPLVDDAALGRLAHEGAVRTLDQIDQALRNKYGDAAAEYNLPKVSIESAGGQLYYALLYSLLKNEAGLHSRGYVVLPAQFPGCSQAGMAALRAWLRESFDGIVIGMAEDYFGENAPFSPNDLSKWGGVWLTIENVVPVNATCFIADVKQWYGEKGASWHRILLEQTKDGWRIDFSAITLMS